MPSMQQLKRRIESVGTTRQIAQAMQMVSSTKISRARATAEACAPFYQEYKKMLQDALRSAGQYQNQYLQQTEVKNTLYIVVGSDRGLCGPYNINVARAARASMTKQKTETTMIAVGGKMQEAFRRNGPKIVKVFTGVSENPFFSDAAEIGKLAMEKFKAGEVQRVKLVYTQFISMLQQKTHVRQLLPLVVPAQNQEEGGNQQPPPVMYMEPDEESVLERIIPAYIYSSIYHAMVEGAACEQSSRVTSMDSAVKNSEEMIDKMELTYNQLRQSAITQELNEIVGAAEALR